MLGRFRLKRGAGPGEPVAPAEVAAPAGNAWDILGGSAIRHPDAQAAADGRAAGGGATAAATAPAVAAPVVAAPTVAAPVIAAAGAEADPGAVVRALFEGTLGRGPSEEEVGFYLRLREGHGDPGWMGASLRILTASPEFMARMRAPVEAATLGTAADGDAAPMRHAVSLGTHCYASWLLGDMGLRRSSSPFDWLFSSPALIRHCLEDDFATLLDPAHHEQFGVHRQALHRFYNRGFGTEAPPMGEPPLFFHHNPTTEDDHARLVRGVARFRRLLDSPDEKLFLMVVARNRPQAELAGGIEALAGVLDARTRNATLLAVVHAGIVDRAGANTAQVWAQGRHSLHALRSSSDMVEGLSFAHQFDNLLVKRLVYQHRFELKPAP